MKQVAAMRLTFIPVLVLAALCARTCADTASYDHAIVWDTSGTCTDLGALPGGSDSRAYCVNQSGQVAGWSTNAQGTMEAVRWDSSGVTDLGPGSAYGINASGQVVGESSGEAVMWDADGTMHDIDPGIAYGINDDGCVVGGLATTTAFGIQTRHAFSWSVADGLVDLGTLDGAIGSSARSINTDGSIVGVSIVNDDYGQAFLATAGQDWQTIGDGTAMGVNDAGQVIGNSLLGEGFIWDSVSGSIALGMSANGLNEAGWVAGTSAASNAAMWTPAGGVTELALPYGSIRSVASDINDHGQIAGYAMFAPKATVPEPSSIVTIILGLCGLARMRLVRRTR